MSTSFWADQSLFLGFAPISLVSFDGKTTGHSIIICYIVSEDYGFYLPIVKAMIRKKRRKITIRRSKGLFRMEAMMATESYLVLLWRQNRIRVSVQQKRSYDILKGGWGWG